MGAQAARQVAVQLDDGERAQALYQGLRECRQTRADFDHVLARHRGNGVNNGVNDAAIRQKVLAKTLAGNVLHQSVTPKAPRAVMERATQLGSRISTKARLRISRSQF